VITGAHLSTFEECCTHVLHITVKLTATHSVNPVALPWRESLWVNLAEILLLLLLLLHDLYSANFEDRVGGAGVARWRTWL